MSQELRATPAHTEDKLQATLTVSNTDIVTMLAVKNRENLKLQREALAAKYKALYLIDAQKLATKFRAAVKRVIKQEIIDALEHVIKLCNPRDKVALVATMNGRDIEDGDLFVNAVCCAYHSGYGQKVGEPVSYTFKSVNYSIRTDNEDEYPATPWSDNDNDELQIPCRKTTISIPYNKTMEEIGNQIDKIDALTKNEGTLREQIVAQVTERAVRDSDMLSTLVGDIPLLSIQ